VNLPMPSDRGTIDAYLDGSAEHSRRRRPRTRRPLPPPPLRAPPPALPPPPLEHRRCRALVMNRPRRPTRHADRAALQGAARLAYEHVLRAEAFVAPGSSALETVFGRRVERKKHRRTSRSTPIAPRSFGERRTGSLTRSTTWSSARKQLRRSSGRCMRDEWRPRSVPCRARRKAFDRLRDKVLLGNSAWWRGQAPADGCRPARPHATRLPTAFRQPERRARWPAGRVPMQIRS
jgi:hypothetical protein